MDISDEKLFQDPPPKEDCLICMLPMPFANGACGVGKAYMACCGKTMCSGCMIAEKDEMKEGNLKKWCSLCRVPLPGSDEEFVKRLKKRMKLNDKEAFNYLGQAYRDGSEGLTKNLSKALELYNQAAELGSCNAHALIAGAYMRGDGVEQDKEKGIQHLKHAAAIGGHEMARYALGMMASDRRIAMRHHMIAAKSGHKDALKKVGEGYKAGHLTKEDYASTLRAHQVSVDEMKSKQRDIADES